MKRIALSVARVVLSVGLLACGSTPLIFLSGDGGAVVPYDGGGVLADGGSSTEDGGAIGTDGGPVTADGGTVTPDGGPVAADGGPVSTDGGILPGERCDNPQPLAPGSTTSATLSGYRNDYGGGNNCAQPSQMGAGPDRVFAVTIPARTRLDVTVTPTGFDVMVDLIAAPASSCRTTNNTCLAGRDSGGAGGAEQVSFTNSQASSRDVFIVVKGFSPTDSGAFTVVTAAVDLSNLPGDACSRAETLGTTAVQGTTVGYTNDFESGTGCAAPSREGSGPDRAYAISVPAGKRLTVAVQAQSQWDPMLNLLVASASGDCALTGNVCVAGRDVNGAAQGEEATYVNTTAAAQTIWVVVDGYSPTDTGPYTLQARLDDPPPPNSGDTCASAVPLMSGVVMMGTTVGYTNDYGQGNNCRGTPGPDRVYSIDVPAGRSLSATVTPTGTPWDTSINLMAGPASNCDAQQRTCLAGAAQNGAGQPETVTWRNESQQTVPVFVIVESPFGASGTFNLTATLGN